MKKALPWILLLGGAGVVGYFFLKKKGITLGITRTPQTDVMAGSRVPTASTPETNEWDAVLSGFKGLTNIGVEWISTGAFDKPDDNLQETVDRAASFREMS